MYFNKRTYDRTISTNCLGNLTPNGDVKLL